MIKYIGLLIIAVALAQAFIAALAVYFAQLKNNEINFAQAIRTYAKSNLARYVLVAVCVAIISFLLSEYMNLSLSRADLLKKGFKELTRTEKIQLHFKTYAVCVGAFIELIAVIFYRAGFNSIAKFGKEKGADTDDIKPVI